MANHNNIVLEDVPTGVAVLGPISNASFASILNRNALEFLAGLQRNFNSRRLELLAKRIQRQSRLDGGELPDFLPETKNVVREDPNWKVASIPRDLQDRRVEITGPVDRKMVINALNCGAKVFMADFGKTNKIFHLMIDRYTSLSSKSTLHVFNPSRFHEMGFLASLLPHHSHSSSYRSITHHLFHFFLFFFYFPPS
jgi:hypothetical protein